MHLLYKNILNYIIISFMQSDLYTSMDNKYNDKNSNKCIVYKFRSRPPYEGFILLLIIVLITIIIIKWLIK